VRTFIERHPLVVYFVLVFTISWGGLLWAAGGPGGIPVAPDRVDTLLPGVVLSVLAGPSVAGLLLTALVDGSAGLRAVLARLVGWRVGPRWYVWALLSAPLLMGGLLLALSLVSPVFRPGVVTSPEPASFLRFGIVVGLSAGFFEELGWTGFALPRLRRRYGVAGAGLVLGLAWAVWHVLPAVWLSGAVSGRFALTSYLLDPFLYLIAFRVLMVWVYEHTGSLLMAMLMHASLTASARVLTPAGLAGAPLLTFDLVWAAAMGGIVVVAVARGGRLSRPLHARRPEPLGRST
jgi:membrane protease YdiL (CAAX protease family)